MKTTRGFSYLEVLIAGALFSIALLAVIPVMASAARNMIFAQEAYAGHLQAQRLMLAIRENLLTDEPDPEAHATTYADGNFNFSVRIYGRNATIFHSCPEQDATLTIDVNPIMQTHASTIFVVVWDDDNQILGRAIGTVFID